MLCIIQAKMSLRDVMDAAKGLTNMYLAHEIAVDKDFMLQASHYICIYILSKYRVAHLLWERFMLTSNSKFRHRPWSQDKFTAKRNLKFGANISLFRSRWATL